MCVEQGRPLDNKTHFVCSWSPGHILSLPFCDRTCLACICRLATSSITHSHCACFHASLLCLYIHWQSQNQANALNLSSTSTLKYPSAAGLLQGPDQLQHILLTPEVSRVRWQANSVCVLPIPNAIHFTCPFATGAGRACQRLCPSIYCKTFVEAIQHQSSDPCVRACLPFRPSPRWRD